MLPTAPEVELNWIVGVVMVNVALAVFPAASVNTTVFVATAVSGTLNVVANAPNASVVQVVAGSVIAWPLNVAVTLLDAAKPVPATATVVPLAANVGVSVTLGSTVIAACAFRPVFESINVSRYVPAKRPVGTMNHVVVVYALAPSFTMPIGPNWFTVLTC